MKLGSGSTASALLLSALCSVPGGRTAFAVAFTFRTTIGGASGFVANNHRRAADIDSAAKNANGRTTPCRLAATSDDRRDSDAESGVGEFEDYPFWPAASFLAASVSFPEAASALSPSVANDAVAIDRSAFVDGLSGSSSLTTSLELSDALEFLVKAISSEQFGAFLGNAPILLPLLALAVAGGGFLSFLVRVNERKNDIKKRIAAEELLRQEAERPIIEFDDIGGSWDRLPMLGKTVAFFTVFFGVLFLPVLLLVAPIIQEQVLPKLPKIELTVPKIEVPKLELPKIALPGDLGATKAEGEEAAAPPATPPADEAAGQDAAPAAAAAPSGEEAKAPAAESPAAADAKPAEESKPAAESKPAEETKSS